MTEIPYPELFLSSRYLDPNYQPDKSHPVWQQLRSYPPNLIAIISDSIQYLVDDQDRIIGFEPSDGARDRIDTAIAIHQEFPSSQVLTLSTSFDNLLTYLPEAVLYQFSMLMTGQIPPGNFIIPDGRTYDTFTELIKIAQTTLPPSWGDFDNIAIVAGRKQADRISVMLNTLRNADDPIERAQLDRYFKVYMPHRLKVTTEERVQEAFDYFENMAYQGIVPNVALLRNKHFLVVAPEDVIGTNLIGTNLYEEEDRASNLQGVQDWLDGTYGQLYLDPQADLPPLKIVVRSSSALVDTPRRHIPHSGTAEAKERGIAWGIGLCDDF